MSTTLLIFPPDCLSSSNFLSKILFFNWHSSSLRLSSFWLLLFVFFPEFLLDDKPVFPSLDVVAFLLIFFLTRRLNFSMRLHSFLQSSSLMKQWYTSVKSLAAVWHSLYVASHVDWQSFKEVTELLEQGIHKAMSDRRNVHQRVAIVSATTMK